MPNTVQAKKRMRQNEVRRAANRARKTIVKTFTKKTVSAIDEKSFTDAEQLLRETQSRLDKAAKTNAIHKNKAARRKSRLQKRLNAAKAAK